MMKLVILTRLLATVSAGFIAPHAYYASFEYAAFLLTLYNYRGALSLAPGQPANNLGADGRPLDTLEVNLDRYVLITAKALDSGVHLVKKRSIYAPVVSASINRLATPLASDAEPFAYRYAKARLASLPYVPTVY